jgi:hypothetical protein
MRISLAAILGLATLSLAACHPGNHGSASFSEGPIDPHATLATLYGYSTTPYVYGGPESAVVDFFDGYSTCGALPRCGYAGASILLSHRLDGGTLALDTGSYSVVPLFPANLADAGPSGEVREAMLRGFYVTDSTKPGRGPPIRTPFSETGCGYYETSAGSSGTVVVVGLDGGTLRANLDAKMEGARLTAWKGSFEAPICSQAY